MNFQTTISRFHLIVFLHKLDAHIYILIIYLSKELVFTYSSKGSNKTSLDIRDIRAELLFANNIFMAERVKMVKVCAGMEPWSVMDKLKAFDGERERGVSVGCTPIVVHFIGHHLN